MFLTRQTLHRSMLATVLSVLFATANVSQATEAQLPECHVLSIGVENYTRAQQLPGCAKDATFLAERFAGQQGKMFSKVNATILVNSDATKAAIEQQMTHFSNIGKAGDWVVLVYSGHNSGRGTEWGFLAQDEQHVSGKGIADLADGLAKQGKKVIIIMDNCFSGNLRLISQDALERHDAHSRGGIVLITASVPTQTSITRLHQFSILSKAVDEGLAGEADYNNDGSVTLQELRRYVYARVHGMLGYPNGTNDQDSEIDYSLSISESMVVAKVRPAVLVARTNLTAQDAVDTARSKSYCKVFTVQLQKGVTYTIDMKSTQMDSYLRLENAGGTELTRDDDGGEGRNARIVFTPRESGSYRIIATTYNERTTGAFTVIAK